MKHYIIVKLQPDLENAEEILEATRKAYASAVQIPGILKTKVHLNCVDRENRSDFMIEMEMVPGALANWDASPIHKQWKEQFSTYFASKAVIDCND